MKQIGLSIVLPLLAGISITLFTLAMPGGTISSAAQALEAPPADLYPGMDLEPNGSDEQPAWQRMDYPAVEIGVPVSCTHPLPDDMCVYQGDLHSHTSYSDGQGTPQDAYQVARANGLDFLAITDHAFLLDDDEWRDTLAQARAATAEDQFVGLRGFEWTSASDGHANVFGTESFVQAYDPGYDSLGEFYAWLSDPAQIYAVAQFNHPNSPPDSFNELQYDPLADLHVSLIEVNHGTSIRVGKYEAALAAGWHLAPANNSDTHLSNWGERRGRTGIVAPGLTYHHVIDALRTRRTFASSDENLALVMRADGYWMGSVVPYGPTYFEIHAFDPDSDDHIATLELYRNGDLLKSTTVNTNSVTWTFSLSTLPSPGTWWYARATQSDDDSVYTSPIWTYRPGQYDVLIRDNMWDVGDVPSPEPGWQSPDIWIRRQADDQIWHENPVAGEVNFVYARVHNIGSEPLTDIGVLLYWTGPVLGPIWPDSWTPINSTPIQIHSLAPGESIVVSMPWSVPISAPEHVSLLARLLSSQDPIRYEGNVRWDNNIGLKSVHIVEPGDGQAPPGTSIEKTVTFYLNNPSTEEKAADLRVRSDDFPAQGSLTLGLEAELFDRWVLTDTEGLVKGAVVDPISRTITITSPASAAVYGLPLLARESTTITLTLGVPSTSTLAIYVSEEIDGEEIGGNLYATPSSGVPRKINLEAALHNTGPHQDVEITAAVVGTGFIPVTEPTQVRFSTTLGILSADTVQTQGGLATVMLDTGADPGNAIVRASATGLVTATTLVNVYRTCWVRLNDSPVDYSTVQAAVDASTHITDVVKVAGWCTATNTYAGQAQVVYINKTLTVRGGYTTTNWSTSNPTSHPTTLDAQGRGRVIYVTGDVSPTIEGLYITGGDAEGLGGGSFGEDAGGGVYIISATAIIKGNHISSNTAFNGGGLYLSSSDATLVNNMVTDNRAGNQGGGLYVDGGSPRLLHTTIVRNTGGDGIGVYVTGSESVHSTVALTNTILSGHRVGIAVAPGNTATLEATLWGSGIWANKDDWDGIGVITGTLNIWDDPAFVAPDTGDYHIGVASAALDAGLDAGVNDDVDGDPRPMGGGHDIGADERWIEIHLPVVARNFSS